MSMLRVPFMGCSFHELILEYYTVHLYEPTTAYLLRLLLDGLVIQSFVGIAIHAPRWPFGLQ